VQAAYLPVKGLQQLIKTIGMIKRSLNSELEIEGIPSSSIVALAKALHTTPNYLLMGEAEEDPWMEDVMQVLSEIKDPAMRKLAINQLRCIARIS
jgi:hypothetical protein